MSAPGGSSLENDLRRRLDGKSLLFMSHLIVGYPSLEANMTMLAAMDSAGVDLVELQMPFSEPIADGPYFTKANQDAIQAGITWSRYFDFAARATARFRFPMVFMGYYNSIFRMGPDRFCANLADAGLRGCIVPDLPLEEAAELNALGRARDLDQIFVMSPMNSPARLAEIGRHASGFVYCTARRGVTGRKTDLSEDVAAFMGRCRAATSVPLGLGFGIGTPADVRAVRGLADIAIVGTAGLKAWEELGASGYELYLKGLAAETS